MLPKVNRLTKEKDFDLVFKNGKSTKTDFFIIGGAVLLQEGLKPATKDIDIVVKAKKNS